MLDTSAYSFLNHDDNMITEMNANVESFMCGSEVGADFCYEAPIRTLEYEDDTGNHTKHRW